jgi:hypothetical protein
LTTAGLPTQQERRPARSLELKESRYDQVSSLLVSLLVLLGLITSLMFIIWLSTRLFWQRPPVAVQMLEDVGGGSSGDNLTAAEPEFEEPLPEEVPLTEPPVEDTFESISTVVNEVPPPEDIEPSGYGRGEGNGVGDGRGPGPGGPGTSDGIPAWERWEIRMHAGDSNAYAKQLDFFKVELGVAGGGNPNVTYVSKFTQAKPAVRTGAPKDEKRLRFLHQSGELRAADRAIVAKAGVNPEGKVVFQFYPDETYKQLLTLENIKMGKRRIIEVRKTVFGVREKGAGYEFYIISQEYRDGTTA